MRRDTIKNDVDEVMISHFCIYVEFIEIIEVLLNQACLFECYNIVIYLVCLIMVPIIASKYLLNF